jgi:hypothetical protein
MLTLGFSFITTTFLADCIRRYTFFPLSQMLRSSIIVFISRKLLGVCAEHPFVVAQGFIANFRVMTREFFDIIKADKLFLRLADCHHVAELYRFTSFTPLKQFRMRLKNTEDTVRCRHFSAASNFCG